MGTEIRIVVASAGVGVEGIEEAQGNFLGWWEYSRSLLRCGFYECVHLSKLIGLYS